MQQFDENTIIERMKTLPDDLQSAIVSVDVAHRVQTIGEKHGLLIDEIGALSDVAAYVMLGLIPGKKFVSTLRERADIDEKKATEIAADINEEVFKDIRGSLEKIETEKVATADANNEKDLEKAGNMSVEKNLASEDVLSGFKKPAETMSRAATLNALENPPAFVDHLLTGTVTSVSETVVKQAPNPATPVEIPKSAVPTTPASPVSPAPYKKDPYRESIE